ncbi:hypothetical protein [Yinghuangia sp. YIM S09857]|uniref:hypothetical protein n=1 Tax=Yinghuangia sp. YIM S09857 TaxID=3436929 RepID=UPI003F53C915
MTSPTEPGTAAGRPDDRLSSVFRFATEIIAWVAAPWALAAVSWVLALAAVVLLILLPTVFSTPGDKNQVVVAVPGVVTIVIMLVQFGAAVAGAWAAWPRWAAVAVCGLVAVAVVLELPRWRWLLRTGR